MKHSFNASRCLEKVRAPSSKAGWSNLENEEQLYAHEVRSTAAGEIRIFNLTFGLDLPYACKSCRQRKAKLSELGVEINQRPHRVTTEPEPNFVSGNYLMKKPQKRISV